MKQAAEIRACGPRASIRLTNPTTLAVSVPAGSLTRATTALRRRRRCQAAALQVAPTCLRLEPLEAAEPASPVRVPSEVVDSDEAAPSSAQVPLETLAPKYVPAQHKTYLDRLDAAIRNPETRNIALTGRYGSGKSSVLEQFQRDHTFDQTSGHLDAGSRTGVRQ